MCILLIKLMLDVSHNVFKKIGYVDVIIIVYW
jgi:hypothetical protein